MRRDYRITLGKMLNAKQQEDDSLVVAPYLRAGSIQPNHLDLTPVTMRFTDHELAMLTLRANDLVVVEGGAGYGRSHWLSEDLVGWGFQNHVLRVRSRSNASTRFLDYVLRVCNASGIIASLSNNATLPSLSSEKLGALRVPRPPLPEQRAIADYLDRETAQIDALIGKQEQLIETLRERRLSVTERALLDVPVEAVRLRYLFRPSGTANHPEEQVLSVYRDFGVIPKASRDDNFNRTPENIERYLLVRPGDLVVNRMKAWQGSLGVSAHRGVVSGDYEVLRPLGARLLPEFAHRYLRSSRMVTEYRLHSTGIRPSQWRLYWDQMGDLEMPIPPLDEQRRIADYLDEQTAKIDALIAKAERFIEVSKERRSALITAAVTGQIDVRGRVGEQEVEAV